MAEEHTGAVVKRLRLQAGLTQGLLAKKAGISERWLRSWECGHVDPSDDARSWVVRALAEKLGRPPENLDREIGDRPAERRERAKTVPLRLAIEGGGAEAAVHQLLGAALEGFRAEPHVHRHPSLLQHDAEGSLFLMERHNGDPAVADLRSDYVIVYVPWSISASTVKLDAPAVKFDAPLESELGAELPDVGPLPFVGVARNFALPIPRSGARPGTSGPASRDRQGEIRARALVTPLCRERTSPAVPQLLSAVMRRSVPGGPVTRRDITNWLDLAQSLATALWSLHASGWAHLGVTAENVVLRVDHGIWRDITLFNVWDDGRLKPGTKAESTKRRDLFDLGRVLVGALAGRDVDIDPEELRPPLFDARRRFAEEIHGEANRRALNLCLRYLLELHPPPPATAGPQTEQPPLPSSGESSARVLMKFINEIGALRALQHRRSLAQPPLRVAPNGDRAAAPRRPLEGPRSTIPPSLPPPSAPGSIPPPASIPAPNLPQRLQPTMPRSRPGSLSTLLAALSRHAEPEERKGWCDRYIAAAEPEGRPMDIDACTEILARGHGRTATALLQRLAEQGGCGPSSSAESARLLRLLVGVLLQRENAPRESERVLSRFRGVDDARLAWWVQLLDQRWSAENGLPVPATALPPRPDCADHAEAARTLIWDVSHRGLLHLKRDGALSPAQVRDITRLLHGESAHEAIFGALLLARAGGREGSPEGILRGIRSVLLACSYATTKAFPHEYAASLALGAWLIRVAARSPELRATLSARGTDVDECLVVAAECDLQAAEMYQWLDVPTRSCQALRAAAECLFLCDAPEWALRGFRWLSLARNQRLLPWDPPDLVDEALREKGLRADRHHPADAGARDEALWRRGVERWWERTKDLPGGALRRDPGAVLADNYYDLYGPGIEWAFGTGGVSVELLREDTQGAPAPRLGATIDALLELARRASGAVALRGQRILDVGCGAGAEAVYLATQGFDVLGVDSSAWAVQRAEARRGTLDASFLCRDATMLDPDADDLRGRFDWVLLRDSLAHFVGKPRVLEMAFACLKPGGTLIGSDWIQRRTSSRWAWWRLFETVWYASIESEVGMGRLLAGAGLTGITTERHDQEMRAFFEHRLAWVESGTRQPAGETDEMAVRLRARSDIATMRDLSGPDGPIGWLFFTARRPPAR